MKYYTIRGDLKKKGSSFLHGGVGQGMVPRAGPTGATLAPLMDLFGKVAEVIVQRSSPCSSVLKVCVFLQESYVKSRSNTHIYCCFGLFVE